MLRRTGRAARCGLAGLAVLLLAAAGCSRPGLPPEPEPTGQPLAWSAVALPPGLTPSSLVADSDGVLVGGRASDGLAPHPVLLRIDAAGSPTPVSLHPVSPYAPVADLWSLAVRGAQVTALGRAYGGAHANPRWTVWTGTDRSLTDRPQSFETFGGQSAGGLIGVAAPDGGPVVVGNWASPAGGLDAAVWRQRGETWLRGDSAGTALASSRELQVTPRRVTASGPAVLVAGSVLRLGAGVQQQAAAWIWPDRSTPWRLVALPDGGARSEASSAACAGPRPAPARPAPARPAPGCWLAGWVDGRVAVWSVPLDGGPVTREAVPEVAVDVDGPGPRVAVAAGQPVVLAGEGGAARLLLRTPTGWTQRTGPGGTARELAAAGDRLWALVDEGAGVGLRVARP